MSAQRILINATPWTSSSCGWLICIITVYLIHHGSPCHVIKVQCYKDNRKNYCCYKHMTKHTKSCVIEHNAEVTLFKSFCHYRTTLLVVEDELSCMKSRISLRWADHSISTDFKLIQCMKKKAFLMIFHLCHVSRLPSAKHQLWCVLSCPFLSFSSQWLSHLMNFSISLYTKESLCQVLSGITSHVNPPLHFHINGLFFPVVT